MWLYQSAVICRTCCPVCFFFQAEDGIRDLVRSRGLGDVYKRQVSGLSGTAVRLASIGTGVMTSGGVSWKVGALALALSLIHI